MKLLEDLEKLTKATVDLNKPNDEDRRIIDQEKRLLSGGWTEKR